jgi:RimJ/RimL family protein N-acetyltransferase
MRPADHSFKLLVGFDEKVIHFVEALIPRMAGTGGFRRPASALGVLRDGKLVGGMVYTNFDTQAGTVELSCAARDGRWFTRPILYNLFRYAFEGLGCQMVWNRFSSRDAALKRMCVAYGFKVHAIERAFGRDEDSIVGTLTVERWRQNGFHKEHRDGQT